MNGTKVTLNSSAAGRAAAKPGSPAAGEPPPAFRGGEMNVAAARFDAELRAITAASQNIDMLRNRVLNCVVKHQSLVGGAFYQLGADQKLTATASVLDHPIFQQSRLQAWAEQTVLACATESADRIVRSPLVRNLALIAIPFRVPEHPPEALMLLVTCGADAHDSGVERSVMAANSVVWSVSQWVSGQQLTVSAGGLRTTSALLELNQAIDTASNLQAAAQVVVDSLADYLKCESVVLTMRKPGRSTGVIAAVSGSSSFDRKSPQLRLMTAALDECLVRNSVSVLSKQMMQAPPESLALQALVRKTSLANATTIPLINAKGEAVAAICVSDAIQPEVNGTDGSLLVRTLGAAIGPSIDAAHRRQPSLLKRASHRLLNSSRRTLFTFTALLAGLACLLVTPFDYRIDCEFECAPVNRQICVAPYNGLLKASLVQPGDLVRQGQALALMDDRELRLELGELAAEREKIQKERLSLLAEERVAESYLSALEMDRISHRQQLLSQRRQRLEITSQSDGVVLSGGSDRRENFPVTIGDALFEVAALSPLRMEVAVPAEEIRHVRLGMPVEFRPASDPSCVIHGEIRKIRPRADVRESENVFIAELQYDNSDHRLRPGMKGHAKVVSDAHPLAWNLFHRAWEHTLVKVWW